MLYGKTTSLSNIDDNNHCIVKNRFNSFIIYNNLVEIYKNLKLTFYNPYTFKIAYLLFIILYVLRAIYVQWYRCNIVIVCIIRVGFVALFRAVLQSHKHTSLKLWLFCRCCGLVQQQSVSSAQFTQMTFGRNKV